MTTTTKIRRAAIASLLVGSTILSTGCMTGRSFSLASLNPFSSASHNGKSEENTAIAKSKGMLDRSKKAVTGVFADRGKKTPENKSDVDPLRLDHKNKVGPEVFVANGRLWESTGNTQKAMESYTKALEIKENDAEALASMARLHFKEGKHDRAIDFFQRALSQNPDDASLHNDLGLTYSKVGDHAKATSMLKRALELSPGVSRYANNLASIKFKAGDAGGAYKVLAGNNKAAVAHYNMAYLYHKSGQMNEARTQLASALKYTPQSKSDSSIARAVESSRTLLAQIDGPEAIASVQEKAPAIEQVAQQKPTVTTRQVSQQVSTSAGIPVRSASMRIPVESSQTTAQLATAKLGSRTPPVPAMVPSASLKPTSLPKVQKPDFDLPTPKVTKPSAVPSGPFVMPEF